MALKRTCWLDPPNVSMLTRKADHIHLARNAQLRETSASGCEGCPRRARMVTNCLPVSAHQFDAAVERAAL